MPPSKRHLELQNMVATWIDNRSIKMCVLPECRAVGYVADFVALACMHNQYHEKYTYYSDLKPMSMSSVVKDDYRDRDGDDRWTYKIHGDIDRYYVCVFEVKVLRTDFLNTFGDKTSAHAQARMEPVGTAHWVVADKGVCKAEELPSFWGLLEPYGAGLTEKRIPKLNILSTETIHSIAFDMLWEQMNFRTSYYDQIRAMAESIGRVKAAIVADKPVAEISRKCDLAIKACGGLCSI